MKAVEELIDRTEAITTGPRTNALLVDVTAFGLVADGAAVVVRP